MTWWNAVWGHAAYKGLRHFERKVSFRGLGQGDFGGFFLSKYSCDGEWAGEWVPRWARMLVGLGARNDSFFKSNTRVA